jgi:6,7-dimethyl-8-ribityllumazine synthase
MNGPEGLFALVVARFYEELAQKLENGAHEVLLEGGALGIEVFDVPGAFELPIAALYAAESARFAGVVCLGAVIRGETDHYDHVCRAAAVGIQEVSLRTRVPCSFGVLTVDSMEQALARAGGGKRHQGRDAARAVLAMAALRARLASG